MEDNYLSIIVRERRVIREERVGRYRNNTTGDRSYLGT
jgi:hypothetical protein